MGKPWSGIARRNPGDTATWVGDRNRKRYASGFGTLTWYTASGKIFARYYGNMVNGKFDGPVNAHSNGRVAHASFAEGTRVSPWAGGAASLRGGFADRKSTPAPPPPEVEKPEKRDVVAETKKEPRETTAEAPKKETPPPPPPKPAATPKPKPTATPGNQTRGGQAISTSACPKRTSVSRTFPDTVGRSDCDARR